MAAAKKYPPNSGACLRLNRESDPKPTIRRLAEQLNMHHEALRNWIRQAAEADAGERTYQPSSQMAEENRRLREEAAEMRRVNEILRVASSSSRRSSARPGDGHEVHRRTHRDRFAVALLLQVLNIAEWTDHQWMRAAEQP